MSEADSLTEVIRRALSVYDTLLTTVHEGGGKVVLRDADGTERELLIS